MRFNTLHLCVGTVVSLSRPGIVAQDSSLGSGLPASVYSEDRIQNRCRLCMSEVLGFSAGPRDSNTRSN